MKGATINSANTISYGTISNYNNSGNYEFSAISSISGNVITLVNPLTRPYTASDIIQLIKVPVYNNNINISGVLTCLPWSGTIGGVLVFETSGTVTFNNNINVNGRGFLGGNLLPGSYTCGGDTMNYVISSPSSFGAKKGEGIFVNPLNSLGKGKNANGGGGGNDINGGGGGGGNYGVGGRGGFFRSSITCPPNFTLFCGGIGGEQLNYSNTNNKVFLGGGGGAGHQNNAVGTAGGNGGGIVLIKAANIVGNSNIISAEGDDVPVANIDGAGGGGSGGSVLLDVTSFSSLNVSVAGGDGGSDNANASDAHGKGGGGGGGIIWTSGSQSGITAFLNGGAPGIFLSPSSPYFNTSFGAVQGQGGGTLTGLSFPGILSSGTLTPVILSTGVLSCSNPTTQLSVTPNSATNTILWSGPGIVGSNNTATIMANVVGVYSVSIISTGLCGNGTATFNLQSGIGPLTLTPSPLSAQICSSSGPVTLSVTGAANYTWSPASSLVPSTGSIVSASPSVTTTYTINGVTGVCSGSATVTVSVNASPTITPSTSNTLICNGSSATLSVVGASTYTWNPGNLNGTPIIVSPTTTTVYTVTGTTGLCTDTKTISVTVDNGPIVSVIGSPTTICSTSGSSSTLIASGALNYTWSPGAIISSSIIITPTITTSYSVSGVNIFGCISTTTISFSVTPTPTLIPISSSTAICIGNSATLSATGANSYTWNPGALTGGTVIVTPIANTTYTVSGSNGNCVSSQTISIIVNSNPTLTSNSSPTLVCSGNSSTLTANGALTYTWSPGAISGQTINITPATTTNYTVTGTNATGCTASAVTSVSVNITPTINPIASPTAICRGNSATLTASGATNYTWLPGGFTSTSIVVSPTVNTTYTVIGNTGNCSSIKTVTLIVRPTPNINIITIPPVICNGGTSILLANGALSYTWSPGSSFSNTMIVSPSVTTSYTVTGTNIFGCRNTAVTTVTVNPTPTITTLASSTMACLGASVNLTSSGALNYILNPGAQTGSLIVVTPTVTTTYTITGVNIFGCIGSNTVTINVGSNPTITANSSSTIACNGTSVSLTANGATNYTWMPVGINGSSIITTATNSINTYTVIGEIGGCVGSSTLSVLVIDCSKVFGMTKAASKPVLINNSFYNVTF
ncbi:MAG: hypothetical protein Q8T03_07340, partial [Bacteroidota bacterium]|nr:hypothetical protein [Bacteroidota bacterium]